MPLRALKQCKSCTNLTRNKSGYCEEHERDKAEISKQYDHTRDKKYVKFYHSTEWNNVRQQALRRDKGLCQYCLREKEITYADMVHHIVEVRTDWTKRLVLSNLISLCDSCHSKIKHKR